MKRAVESSVIKVFTYFFFEVDLRGFRDTASLKRLPRKDVSTAYTVLSMSIKRAVVTGNSSSVSNFSGGKEQGVMGERTLYKKRNLVASAAGTVVTWSTNPCILLQL